MILIKFLIFTSMIFGIFALIYKYFNKVKAIIAKVKEKIKAFIYAAKTKIMNVFISIKNFFGERFLRRLPISRASSEESEIAQAGKNNKNTGR